MWAFCAPSVLPCIVRPSPFSHAVCRPLRLPIIAAAKKSSSSNSKRSPSKSKSSSGFQAAPDETSTQQQPSSSAPSTDAAAQSEVKTGVNLKAVDSRGISLEHRLKEEIIHPLRKPKQTLFAALSLSAFLASLISISRFASRADSLQQLSVNLLINITGVTTFAYLTWRQAQFGRRALNSIARRPQLRDLPIIQPSQSTFALPSWLRSPKRVSSLSKRSDVVIIVGRRIQIQMYLGRCKERFDTLPFKIVVFPTDMISFQEPYPIQPDAFADRENRGNADWKAWLADVTPAKRNIVVLQITQNDPAIQPATTYLVGDGDAKLVPLPQK